MRFLGETAVVLASVCAAFTGLLWLAWWLLWTIFVWLPGMFIGG